MAANSSQPTEATDHQLYLRALTHEVKTPLAVMRGHLEAMLADVMNPALTQEHIGRVAQELTRVMAIVEDVGLRVRVEAGQLALRPAPVNMVSIIDFALADAGAAFCGREFEADVPAHLPLVTVDQNMLQVLLATLLYNGALHRVSDEKVTLRVVVKGDALEFSVDDDLTPLPADVIARLFEPRPELPRALQMPQFGLGLRLYVARIIARQMGGEMEVAAGQGTCYRLRLPLQPPTVGDDGAAA